MSDITVGNYRVKKAIGGRWIRIWHLNYNGESEYYVCRWEVEEKRLCVCRNCPPTEIIFVLRAIHKLGFRVESIVSDRPIPRKVDVSAQYAKYLRED